MTDLTKAEPMNVAAEVWQELPQQLQTTDAYREISNLAHSQDYGTLAQILQAAQGLDRPVINHIDSRQVHIHYNPVTTTTTTTTNPLNGTPENPPELKAIIMASCFVITLFWAASGAGDRAGREAGREAIQQQIPQTPLVQPVSP